MDLLDRALLQRKQVTIVCDLLPTFSRFRLPLAIGMIQRGHRVHVIGSQSNTSAESSIRSAGIGCDIVPMNRTGLNPWEDLRYCQGLKAKIRELKPDVLFAYQAKAAAYSNLAATGLTDCSRHVLFPGLGFLFSEAATLKKRCLRSIAVQLYRRSFRSIQTAFFQNEDDRCLLNDYRVFPPSVRQVIVNGSGVPLGEFPLSPPVTEPVRFLMATRLLRAKGVVEFARAARILRARFGQAVQFDLLGPADTNPSAISATEVQRWHREGILSYHGAVDDVRPFLKQASVFVLPSYYMEGIPRSILEAMSMGRPIITTDSRGCRNTVEAGCNGFLVEPRSAASLVDAMTQFIEDPGLIVTMGAASRKLAERKFDVRDVVCNMLQAMGL